MLTDLTNPNLLFLSLFCMYFTVFSLNRNGGSDDAHLGETSFVQKGRSMFPKVLLQWCAAISSCAAEIERKRQGKFQPFRRLFGKKKKREAKGGFDGAELKASFSTGEVCNGVVSDDEESNSNLRELNPIGSRALSHDSIFIPEEPATEPGLNHSMSQENVSDKVRNLQRQIAQGIKFGQRPPSLRKSEGDEGSSDEEEVPRSPLKIVAQVEAEPADTEPKVQGAQQAGPHSTPVKSPRSKRVLPPTGTIESIDLDAVPQSVPRLDNTAAKHKLSIKPKNQRISRKHRRFTQDLQEVSIPGVVQEDLEVAGVSTDDRRRASVESLESFKKQRLHEEERQETRRKRELEDQRLHQEEEERRKRAAEELRLRELEEEEEQRRREEAERRRKEEEERRIREEEESRWREEEKRREEEERRMREEQEHRQREEKRRRLEEQRRKEEEEEEARRQQELAEEERKKKEEAEKLRLREIEEKKRRDAEERRRKEEEEQRRAEELRWREMEERQRPFSFKVSSGEKQILFQKVNLTPVTPAPSHQSVAAVEQRESAKASSSEGLESPSLLMSPYVPHTAILVTGAQLCGTAVNLDHIKDTACKSLLGLGEDKKAQGTPPTKSKTSPDRKSGKTKSLNESSFSTDQSVLAEWASIRSKIFKGVEEGKYDEYPEPSKNQPQTSSDEPPAFSHANLRKTMSASAKFSITPAKKKFGDSNRNSEVFGADDKEAGEEATRTVSPTAAAPAPSSKPQNRTSKTVRIVERGSEECVFAKDLPSFLVPSPGAKPEGPELESTAQRETEVSEKREEGEIRGQDGEDKPSPFGIKLRRTNYSLRFHGEQSTEKRKKRYSAGDSFDGVPSPLTPIEPDSDASSVFSDKSTTPTSPLKEGAAGKFLHASASHAVPRAKPGKSTSPISHSEGEKVPSKPPVYRRPTTSPKPSGAAPTPPPSPLPKAVHGPPGDAGIQRTGAAETSSQEQINRCEEPSAVAQLHRCSQGQVQGEEEPKEKRSFFQSINIPWREKTDRKTELIKREKPSLQSRHSLDSAKVQEKETGPLWITLALQKQKGFREQQQNREDRRSHRAEKLAEKQARERDSVMLVSPTESKGSGSSSPSSKPQTPEEPKRPDSLLGRFERRENLKKANTLPSSVTVEIADSTPSPPAVKEVSKRFPSSDSPQVSTEPAWLALAKRKAKAWSDCPQIIK
ncbi:capping protein inhibiting regulator of actin dynamics isoform X2 [Sander lucioperca]|uniref:capping protein inhibiting regulator of actin dynamics isoform X2 n=1 Tax=Sander lucioperca TaxID=283035 RepID=UPI0016538493|nr:capping protein inhibiting regulator of actin dynamics isoform X2 [Sander lucioperca]